HEAHEPPVVEHGGGDEEVRQVPRAHEEVVEDNGVPRLHDLDGILPHHVTHDRGHGAQVAGAEVALSDHLATSVEERGGEVAPLAHRLRVCGLAEGCSRLVGDGLERRPDHAARDGIDAYGRHAHAEPPIAMIRFPWRSTMAWSSGRGVTGGSRSSITPGPGTDTPGRRRAAGSAGWAGQSMKPPPSGKYTGRGVLAAFPLATGTARAMATAGTTQLISSFQLVASSGVPGASA